MPLWDCGVYSLGGRGLWRQDEEGSVCIHTESEKATSHSDATKSEDLFAASLTSGIPWGLGFRRTGFIAGYKFCVVFASIHPINIPYIVMLELTITSQGKHS